MITATDLGKDFGAQTLFRDASFQLNPGDRYGLVGANGSGKTTLLRMLAGQEEPSIGSVSRPRRLRLGILEQDHFRFEKLPIIEVVMMGHETLWRAMIEKDAILDQADTDFDADRYAVLEDIVVSLDGYSFEARAGEILEGLGIPSEQHRQTAVDPVGRLQAPGSARPCAGVEPRLPLPRRTDQPPGHPFDPVAREVPPRLPRLRGRDLPRPSIPQQRLHPHHRCGLRDGDPLHRELHRFHQGQDPGADAQGGGNRQAREGDRQSPGLRRPLPGKKHQGSTGPEQGQTDRETGDRTPGPVVSTVSPLRVLAAAPERQTGSRNRRNRQIIRREAEFSTRSLSTFAEAIGWR